jgi:uncharacterized caspase-like protein
MRCVRPFLVAAIAAITLSDVFAVEAEKRVALVIGNGDYEHAITLPNRIRDGKLIGETLRKAGFEVIDGTNLGKIDMGRLLDQFTEAAYDADIALVYYAGHGLQVDGHNYLIPVDAELERASQLQTRTIPVDDVLNALPPDPAVGVVILDACRDNPLARTLAAVLPKSRSMSAGLAPVQASGLSHDAGGLLIAYATDPGAVAYDGTGEHSPYTAALAGNLAIPGLEIQSALTRVRAEVSQATSGAQRPWHNASLAREVFIGGLAPAVAGDAPPKEPEAAPPPPSAGVNWDVERTFWEEASKRDTIEYYELYLKRYPGGQFADLAQLSLDQLEKGADVPTAGPPSAAPAAEMQTADAKPEPTTPLPAGPAPAAPSAVDESGRGGDGSGTGTAFQTAAAAPEAQTRETNSLPTTPARAMESATDQPGDDEDGSGAGAAAAAEPEAPTPEPEPLPPTPAPGTESAANQSGQGEDGSSTKIASASPDDKPVTGAEDGTPLPGTPATEAELELDRDGRIDLQLRLSALELYTGRFDGSLGPRSRAAIGAWQYQNGIAETTFLTAEQHLRIVAQTEPMMAEVRARYQGQQAAIQQQPEKAKTPARAKSTKPVGKSTKLATKPTKPAAKTIKPAGKSTTAPVKTAAGDKKPPTKPKKVATKLCTTYDIQSQSYVPCN